MTWVAISHQIGGMVIGLNKGFGMAWDDPELFLLRLRVLGLYKFSGNLL